MRQDVIVVPADHLIIVDGKALRFDFSTPATLHALQWHNGSGHMEWTDDINHPLSGPEAYAEEVEPYVVLWEAEKARLNQEAADAEAARLAEYNSTEARAKRLRTERDRRISATDYLMTPDYPLDEEGKILVMTYRQALRDLPQQPGFPWSGGGGDDVECPWPEAPAIPVKTAA